MRKRDAWIGITFLTALSGCLCQTTLKATVDMIGLKGDVTFTQTAANQATSVSFQLTGVENNVQWEIHENPVDLTVEDKCTDTMLRSKYNNIGLTISSGSMAQTIQASQVSDLKTLLGRSLVLSNGTHRACATLKVPSVLYTTVYAQLQDKIIGKVWFRQTSGENAEVLYDLFDPSASSALSYGWKIYSGPGTDCKSMSTVFNPITPTSGSCSINDQNACAVGDMTGKHRQVTVGQTKAAVRKFSHDSNLPLLGSNSIVGNYLVILDNTNKVISCGKIVELKEKQAQATINKDGVVGSVKFIQKSPFDSTGVYVTLSGLHNAAGGYHVHLFPVPYQVSATDKLCSDDSVAGHWNPYGKPFPLETGTTTDLYEIGDISGKFGLLSGDLVTATESDQNMPLFGPYSVIGRSLVIHKNETGAPRWVCANIEDLGARRVAIATFKYPVVGTIIFSQSLDDPMDDTWIYGELNYADGTTNPTTGHMWMVHENMAGDDAMSTSGRCASTGGMYNPFSVSMSGDYSSQCKMFNPLRCPVGAGNKQTNSLNIRSDDGASKKFFFSTENMPLSGSGSIVGKSAVIHTANGGSGILACTNIYLLRPREAIVDSWSTSVKGYFKFSQTYSLFNDPTKVFMNVSDMGSLAGKYHVHLFPAPKDGASPCSDANVAGHLNPFNINIDNSPAPKTGTGDQYEVGDLSGKNGLFENMDKYDNSYSDNMLNLFGVHSIVGRSVVIHRMSDGTRWSCGNILEDVTKTGGTLHQAQADFSNKDFTGEVKMTQFVYPDGSMSDTTVFVNLKYVDSRAATTNHKMSISDKPVLESTCASSIFNPFQVNTQTGYTECSMKNPLRCSVGDTSSKLGTYSIGGGKFLSTDVNLPLYGKNSVIGRSFVIGSANSGSAVLACQNIKPVDAPKVQLTVQKTAVSSLLEVAKTFAKALQTDPWNVAVYGDKSGEGCGMMLTVQFMGKESSDLQRRFNKMVKDNESSLGSYKPFTCGTDKTSISLLLITFVVLSRQALL